MRRAVITTVLLGLLGVVGVMAAARPLPRVPQEPTVAVDAAQTGAAPAGATAQQAVVPPRPRAPVRLEVVAAGWELLAPGVAMHGGAGGAAAVPGSQFEAAGVRVGFAVAGDAAAIEARLGRGGELGDGAEVAIMPLPALLASYERLQALSPQVFAVVGFSRGADVLTGSPAWLRDPPRRGRVALAGERGSAHAMLGLFALAQAGVDPARIDLVTEGGALQARARGRSGSIDARAVMLSTADAVHLVPIVAVAPKGVIAAKRDALAAWLRVWFAGARLLEQDPTAIARRVAALPGAPEAVELLDALGGLEFVDLREAAAAAGFSGRRAARLDVLVDEGWSLLRGAGQIAAPPPELPPLSAVVLAQLALDGRVEPPARRVWPPARASASPLLVHTLVLGDRAREDTAVAQLGLLADVFARSPIAITVPGDRASAARLATRAAERYGLDPGQFVVRRGRGRGAARIEVLPAA